MKYLKYIIIIVGIILAFKLRWLTDDCFVTFRYIKQFWAGNGLVFNPGERVEGFTHPLWLFMLIPFNNHLEIASQILGILSFGGLLYFLTKQGWIAGLLTVCSIDMLEWATGGLETMFFTFLVFLSVWACIENKKYTGWILLMMILTRPDGLLIALIIILFAKDN